MGRKEKRCAVELGKGVRALDDGVAKTIQNGVVERVEDGVLKDDVLDVVFLACRSESAGPGGGYCVPCLGHQDLASQGWKSKPQAHKTNSPTQPSCSPGPDRRTV